LSEVHKMEMFISRLMRASVQASGVLIFFGILFFLTSGNETCPVDMFDLHWILYGDPFLAPSHVIFLGFAVLIGTPLLRIVASVFVYAKTKDWTFTTITGMVLAVLVVSMLLGVG
jgi:uncharacterized membrane protein